MVVLTDGVARLDLDRLARGSVPTSPCASCEKPTRSHVLIRPDGECQAFDDREIVDELPRSTTVQFAVVCHSCFTDLPLPATRDVEVYTVEETLDESLRSEAVVA